MKRFFHITRYEIKLLSRTASYRVIAALLVGGIVLIQFILQSSERATWDFMAYPSFMPYLNAYLFNIVQALLIAIIVPDLTQTGRAGTVECGHVRPFHNTTYWWGRLTGFILLFALFNSITALCGIFLNIFGSEAPFAGRYYLFYILTLTLPSTVFLTGLGVYLVHLTRHRFTAKFILAAIAIGSLCFYPNNISPTFDFSGNSQPNIFSDFTGHPNLTGYLVQRGIYLLLGIGFIAAGSTVFKRLPHREEKRGWSILGGYCLIAIAVGGIVGLEYQRTRQEKQQLLFTRQLTHYWNPRTAHITHHAIQLQQEKQQVSLESKLTLTNPHPHSLDSIVLFLNPGLKVEKMQRNGESISFDRKNQVLIVHQTLASKDTITLHMHYAGSIEHSFFNPHTDKQTNPYLSNNYSIFKFGEQGAFLSSAFLLLTPASYWYPVTTPPALPDVPYYNQKDLSRFELTVRKPQQATTLSQGIAQQAPDCITFKNDTPLPGISVVGGTYDTLEIRLFNTTLKFYHLKGHSFFKRYFKNATRSDLESALNEHFSINPVTYKVDQHGAQFGGQLLGIEIPAAYRIPKSILTQNSANVEPGMVFLPEYAYNMGFDQLKNNKRKETYRKQGNTENEIESKVFASWIRSCFFEKDRISPVRSLAKQLTQTRQTNTANKLANPYDIRPVLENVHLTILTKEYPAIGWFIASILQDSTRLLQYTSISDPTFLENQARLYLQGKTLEEILHQPQKIRPELIQEIVRLKRGDLLNHIGTQITTKQFIAYIDSTLSHSPFIDLNDFATELKKALQVDLLALLKKWATTDHTGKIKWQDFTIKQEGENPIASVKVFNSGEKEVLISCMATSNDPSYHFFLQPHEAKEVRYNKNTNILSLNSLTYNIPGSTSYFHFIPRRRKGSKTITADTEKPTWETISISPSLFLPPTDEIIVDNDDSTCYREEPPLLLLQRLWKQPQPGLTHQNILNPNVSRWTHVFQENAHGTYRKSFLYKMGGKGQAKVIWETTIDVPGTYEVMALVHDRTPNAYTSSAISFSGNNQKKAEGLVYHYTIHNGKTNEVEITAQKKAEWVSLGTYHFPTGKAQVILDDRGKSNQFIIADAMKWIKRTKE